ncbi:unnamed protein product [Effrenium voratum]|nr:unnamed protein product [Effrenium voratum]
MGQRKAAKSRGSGVVNYVDRDQGYGWIRCSDSQWGMDVLLTELEGLDMGDWVQFELHRSERGPEARHVQRDRPQPPQPVVDLLGEATRPTSLDPHGTISQLRKKRDLRGMAPREVKQDLFHVPTPTFVPLPDGRGAFEQDPAIAAAVRHMRSPPLRPTSGEAVIMQPGRHLSSGVAIASSKPVQPQKRR